MSVAMMEICRNNHMYQTGFHFGAKKPGNGHLLWFPVPEVQVQSMVVWVHGSWPMVR